MAEQRSYVGNPLTLMAIFAGLSESVGAAVLPLADAAAQEKLVWFVILFPTVLMALFFLTLWTNAKLLYGAQDLDTDEARLQLLGVTPISVSPILEAAKADAATEKLQEFWKPGGTVAPENATRLKKWLIEHNIETPLAIFIDGSLYAEDRQRAVKELLG